MPPTPRSLLLPSSPLLLPSFTKPPSSSLLLCRSTLLSTPSLSLSLSLSAKPSPAENSRTIMELASAGTLSTSSTEEWPLAIGAQFVAGPDGAPALCISRLPSSSLLPKATFHVQLEQSGLRTSHCMVMGTLNKAVDDESLLKKLSARWKKKFGKEIDKDLVYLISVEKVLHMEDFNEEGILVASSEYSNAEPDPLRNFAEKIVDEMNTEHVEDVQRLCNIFVDSELQVMNTKMIWVDRLGFDLYIYSDEGVFAARIPFPREVTDEKAVKSSFNSMTHLAWEVEKNYTVPEFEKVKCLKKIR